MTSRRPVGVIDIGSNSIRLVVFEGAKRYALPLFNEKVQCAIGRGLGTTGKLDPPGVARARKVLERFGAIARAMKLAQVDAVATAAVRDARDGAAFVEEAAACCGFPVRILSGPDEAALAADGVLSGIPGALGLVGDLGGGSLEITQVSPDGRGAGATLPLGPLQLLDAAQGNLGKARKSVDAALAQVSWLAECKGQALYAVGGIWRSLARVHMRQHDYPLHVLHHYTIEARAAEQLSHLIAGLSRKTLESMSGLSRRRLETLPYGALVMERLIAAAKVDRVVMSAYGLREGMLYNMLPPEERTRDPLLEAARDVARQSSRVPEHGEELIRWTAPLFGGESAEEARLRTVACLLSDIAWRSHPDYRGAHAFNEILRAPFVGIDHAGRVFLAQCLFHRYTGGDDDSEVMPGLAPIGNETGALRARRLGLALRLGHTLSASTAGILSQTMLSRSARAVILRAPPALAAFVGEVTHKRLAALAAAFELSSRMEITG